MKLFIILLALGAGHITSSFDHLRQFKWFEKHINWLERQISQYGIWDSTVGAILPLIIPCVLLLLVLCFLNDLWSVFGFIFSVFILFICLNREQLFETVDDYIDAFNENDQTGMQQAAAGIVITEDTNNTTTTNLLSGFFIQSQSTVMSVVFWFIVLGPLGALVYRMTDLLHSRQRNIHGGFSDSVYTLYHILNWPVSRLTVLSYALVGSLVDTLETWRQSKHSNITANDQLVTECGLAALQFTESDEMTTASWLEEAQGLLNRSMVLWLAVIAFSTISGWLN